MSDAVLNIENLNAIAVRPRDHADGITDIAPRTCSRWI
jgi:hypothetical protein